MGANFDTRSYSASLSQKEILAAWADDVAQSQYEDGVSYSGHIGMLGSGVAAWHDLKLSEDDAYSWLEEHHEKWESALAISFYKDVKVQPSPEQIAKVNEQKEALDKLGEAFTLVYRKVMNQFANTKAQYCGCKKCGSRLNRAFLKPQRLTQYDINYGFAIENYKGYTCPVCGELLQPPSHYKQLISAYGKVRKGQERLKQASKTDKSGKGDKCWLIGGWCSS